MTGSGQTINMRSQSSVNLPAGTHTLTITVTRLAAPSTVWVDDDWSSAAPGDIVGNGYIFGYNAFSDIAYGIEAVSGSTVNVFAGEYSAFNITSDDMTVIAVETGAVVNTFYDPWYSKQTAMALVGYGIWDGYVPTANATIDGLEFDASGLSAGNDYYDGDAAILYYQSTGLVDGVTIDGVRFDSRYQQGFGIVVGYFSQVRTVTIRNTEISGCNVGIYVKDDTAVVQNCEIVGGGMYSSYCATGIFVDWEGMVTVSGTEIYGCYDRDYYVDSPQPEDAPLDGNEYMGAGIFVEDDGSAIVSGCCNIYDNEYGIYVQQYGALTANGNNIYDNDDWGVFYEWGAFEAEPGQLNGFDLLNCENNWWGHVEGPTVDTLTTGEPELELQLVKGDWVSFGIDYTPWLDGPCPSGDPVGASAKFKGVARSGEPGLKVQFTDLSTPAPGCEIEEWLWNFGDGSTSKEQNPFHVYNREGAFNVTLTVWDSCGFEQTITMKAYITIKKPTSKDTVEPAKLGVSYLNIDPAQVLPNQEVTISANICNSGEERGTKTVSLMVNGEAVASQSVGVSGGSCQQVVFKTSRAIPGTYQVAIDGMTGEFSVLAPRTVTRDVPSQQQTGLGTAGIIAIIAVIVVLIAALIMVFRRD
jgi:PKD repeat protein